MKILKKLIKNQLNRLGYQITRINPRYLSALKYLIRRSESKKSIIFDVGAHHGQTEKIFSKAFSNASIFCFEPFESSFLILKNNVGKNTNIFNVGFSDVAGKFEFHSNFFDQTNSLLSFEKNADQIWNMKELAEKQQVTCEFITLDEFILINNIIQIDLLKLDVQGAEFKVLSGAKKALSEKSIKNIYMEVMIAPTYVGQWSIDQYIKEMGSFGYELYGIYNMYYGSNERLLQVDVIFTISRSN